MDSTSTEEGHKTKFRVGRHLCHEDGGWPRLEAVAKKTRTTHFACTIVQRSTLATTSPTIHNGNNVISVHEWIQPTQQRTKKSNWVWGITSAMELEVNQDLKRSRKIKKHPICQGHCVTIHNGNNVISAHEWT